MIYYAHDHDVFFVHSYATINSTLFISVSKDLVTTLVSFLFLSTHLIFILL